MYGKSNDKPHNASFKDMVFLKIKSRPLLTNGVSLVTLIKTFTSLLRVAFIELPFSLKIIISFCQHLLESVCIVFLLLLLVLASLHHLLILIGMLHPVYACLILI